MLHPVDTNIITGGRRDARIAQGDQGIVLDEGVVVAGDGKAHRLFQQIALVVPGHKTVLVRAGGKVPEIGCEGEAGIQGTRIIRKFSGDIQPLAIVIQLPEQRSIPIQGQRRQGVL